MLKIETYKMSAHTGSDAGPSKTAHAYNLGISKSVSRTCRQHTKEAILAFTLSAPEIDKIQDFLKQSHIGGKDRRQG